MAKYFLNGNLYDSRSEAAVGILLEEYIPDFIIKGGETFHVPIKETHFDFVLPRAVLEWHSFPRGRKRQERFDFSLYRKNKEGYLDNSEYKERQLIVVTSPDELYSLVLARFGIPGSFPQLSSLRGRFKYLLGASKKLTKKDLESRITKV